MSPVSRPSSQEPIAIIGTACHFAGGVNCPEKLWTLLQSPRDVRTEIPDSRFNARSFYHPDNTHHGHSNVLHSYLIEDDISVFDADFFGIKPIEAKAMDPQQRILMETVYEAIEAAGLKIENLKGSNTAVFVGAMCADHEALQLRDLDFLPTYFATGTARSILSNRISYFFDWHGPCMTIDTACSSSLVAVHQAVSTLRSGGSRMAIACGSNLILGPENYIMESKLKMLSPDGLGRMWDSAADGYARGDGVATLVLKTLSSALADGDQIECILRETGVNHDGATAGITMPSAAAQQELIKRTYISAGLDLDLPRDRPQFFEAHGTGTPAGDPIEAEAIAKAFFGSRYGTHVSEDNLYVGSIKTVLGHTEGTAGIAAVLKASLAIQHGQIPPNLLFKNLSPTVAPFFTNLTIAKVAQAWPEVPGAPRRASVNSFGFGGSNAHAILESHVASADSNSDTSTDLSSSDRGPTFTPFVFSAKSKNSLKAYLQSFLNHLKAGVSYSAADLAYTLRQHRSWFAHRVAYVSTSIEDLESELERRLENEEPNQDYQPITQHVSEFVNCSKILGIFTGQGIQYARMGASLIERSTLACQIIVDLECHLSQLPAADRPTWSLRSEILACAGSSRVHEAVISQPVCTAVQILLVDLLRLANVKFDAVVGHSSGEIAAAYAAGLLSARDAIVTAYYRGQHCWRAASPNGNYKGAMLAAATTVEDATNICNDELFAGRIHLAACNSSSNVTFSGDEDAIIELEALLEDEKKFHRRLKVDLAYHSPHMMPCYDSYVKSLHDAGIKVQNTSSSLKCMWYSTVYDEIFVDSADGPGPTYWADNLTKPVLFSQALAAAVSDHGPFEMVLEVAAHPALRGLVSQTMHDIQGSVSYHGCLDRKIDAVEAMSTCLGYLWSRLKDNSVDLNAYEIALSARGKTPFTLVKNLPSYQWNHDVKYWHESRRSRAMRLRKRPFHLLLGNESPDSAPHHLRWKNVLKPREINWLEGHQVQGQIVFPAAGYICTAFEAAKILAAGKSVRLIEMSDFVISQAIQFEDEDSSVEVLIELSSITQDSSAIAAKFTYSAALGEPATDCALTATGAVRVLLAPPSRDTLPQRGSAVPHLIDVEPKRQYKFMESLGYQFTGAFRSLKRLSRKLGKASCELSARPSHIDGTSLLLHPIDLDAAFQAIMLAYSYPGDDQLRTLHLPASIAKIRFNPELIAPCHVQPDGLSVDSTCQRIDREASGLGFSGHANLYVSGYANAALQVDGVRFLPFAGAGNEDRNVFYKMDWALMEPDGIAAADGIPVTRGDTDLFWTLSRIASFYLRKFDSEVPADALVRTKEPLCHYLNYAEHMTSLHRNGKHRYAKAEWLSDTLVDIMNAIQNQGIANDPGVKIMLLVGETMPRVLREETNMIEHMRASGLLDEYYTNGFLTMQSSLWLGNVMSQITDRHPHLRILEIGAGTGGATKNILKAVGQSFHSYTFTDISYSFFETAAVTFAPWKDRMSFKMYDAEQQHGDQGFHEGEFDVIVASLVIHATKNLAKTLQNLRKLLKPGGYLLVAEGSSDGPLQSGDSFIFGGLPGWWLGVDEGRTLSPFVNVDQWDVLLKGAGFSGIDTMAPPKFLETFGVILFVSQAVDEQFAFLREPLANVKLPATGMIIDKLVIVGGITKQVAQLVEEIASIFRNFVNHIVFHLTLEDLDVNDVCEGSTVISLADLDSSVFLDMSPQSWHGFRAMFESGKTLLWVSAGRLADKPLSNMPVGFGRTAANEVSELRIQFLDFPTVDGVDSNIIAESLIRLNAQETNSDNLLWIPEPEVVIDTTGHHLVPRLRAMAAANDRYNSVRRPIFQELAVQTTNLELHQMDNRCTFTEAERYHTAEQSSPEVIELRTVFSTLSALKTELGHQFLTSSVDPVGNYHIAVVSRTSTVFDTLQNCAIPYDINGSKLSHANFLVAVAAYLVSSAIIKPLLPGQTVLLHNATPIFAKAIVVEASHKDVTVVCTVDAANDSSSPTTWTCLPSYLSRSELYRILPSNIASFVGLSRTNSSENEDTILSVLSKHCHYETACSIYSSDGIDLGSSSACFLSDTLKKAVRFAQDADASDVDVIGQTCNLSSLTNVDRMAKPMTIVDWTVSAVIPVQITRLDSKPLFKSDRTYWMCGMSGALGISLCDWMIDRGVRYLVITSRNPKLEQSWIEDHERSGITIRVSSCDVTDEEALRAVYDKIVLDMPPIAGALNGAMVLRDSAVANMQYDQLMDVIRPKVLGSLHLDRIFYDTTLDFMIFISSISCVVGNVGQANYSAANMYLCSLAANRRKRGLNAIALNGGAIMGAGYITRETDRALDVTVEKMALMHLSEEDFHQMVAEAIESGHHNSSDGCEISTGILDISPDSTSIPKWYSNPKLSRFVVHQTASNEKKKEQIAMTSIHDQLQNCDSSQALQSIVTESFIGQLRKILQTSAEVSNEELLSSRSPELGLDSLVSVDIRSWFLKNFHVSVPVLKIMGNSTMANIVQSVVEMVPADLVPLLHPLDTEESSEQTSDNTDGTPDTLASETKSRAPVPTISLDQDIVNWEAESTPPDDFLREPALSGSPPLTSPEVLILTGATGLLGHHLLDSLLSSTSIKTIHCLCVRGLQARLQSGELLSNSRVIYHEGSLSDPLLGLHEQEATSLFSTVDAVIHNGADTSHVKLYKDLRAANVGSTIALTRLCLPRQIPMHYISSVGVALYYGKDTFPEVSISGSESHYPSADGSFGYGCSKWVNERFLERVHEQYNLPVHIYRPSTIIREGADASTAQAQFDWVNTLLHYIRTMGTAPQTQHNRGALDLVRVGTCCDEIIRGISGKDGIKQLTYLNLVGDVVIPLDQMQEMDAGEGRRYGSLPLGDWLQGAIAAGMHPAIALLIENMDTAGVYYPRVVRGDR